jgi:hypothetical protein
MPAGSQPERIERLLRAEVQHAARSYAEAIQQYEDSVSATSIADLGIPDGFLNIRNALRAERAARNRYMRAQRQLIEFLRQRRPR